MHVYMINKSPATQNLVVALLMLDNENSGKFDMSNQHQTCQQQQPYYDFHHIHYQLDPDNLFII